MEMEPYDSGNFTAGSSSSSSSSSSSAGKFSSDIDGLLAGAGYKVRSSELRQVAQRLEQLETVMVNAPTDEISQLASDAIHYNPSNIGSWVDSLLTELNHPPPSDLLDFPDQRFTEDLLHSQLHPTVVNQGFTIYGTPQQQQMTMVSTMEEDSSIRLVHLLMTCAESIQHGDISLAVTLIEEMRTVLTRVNTGSGIGKVAGYFIEALTLRVCNPGQILSTELTQGNEFLYHHFYEACPYLKFAHFTANQAILEAFNGHDCVHVIDFNLMDGLQWPALIQALALRPGGPPFLRLTGIGPPSLDGRDSLREIGLKLAELAWSVNVRFSFRGVAASRLEDVKPWMLQVKPTEALAINSIMQLHKLLGSDPTHNPPIDSVLAWIRNLNPKIVTVVEQEADHNQPEFINRFTEALHYYSTMFDSLEACWLQPEKVVAEMYIQREICNVLCHEGLDRVERHEPLVKWRNRFGSAGFRPVYLGSNAFKQASMLLTLFSGEGYSVEEREGCLTLGWHNRPLIAASAWKPFLETTLPSL